MSRFAFVGGRIVLPYKIVEDHAVLVEGGKIADILTLDDLPCDIPRISLGGAYLMPGFVDIHVHGGGGADVMDATVSAMQTVALTHARHGTTAMCPTTMTCPDEKLYACMDAYRVTLAAGTKGADFLGLHLEGPYLSSGNRGAQPTGTNDRIPGRADVSALFEHGKGLICRLDAAPEVPGCDLLAAAAREAGVFCLSVAHSLATAEETLAAYEAHGFSHITHLYSGTTTEHKRGQTVHGGIVEAAYLTDGMTVELIADGKHIPKETMQLAFRLKGDSRLALVTDAMRAAGTDLRETVLGDRDSGVPVIIEDGVAKLLDRSSYAGSIATMDHALRVVHRRYGLPLCDTVRAMSLTPATIVGAADRKGSIAPGKDADLLIVSPTLMLQATYIRGKRID